MQGNAGEKLMSSTEFAKMCGVTPQTMLNWVKSGRVIPTSVQGRYNFFSKDKFYDVQIALNKSDNDVSCLAVLFGNADMELSDEGKFVATVQRLRPSICRIESLKDSIDKAMKGVDSDFDLVVKRAVIKEMCIKLHTDMLHLTADIIDSELILHEENIYSVMNIAFGGSDWSFDCVNAIKSRYDGLFYSYIRKYGMTNVITEFNLSRSELFYNTFDLDKVVSGGSTILFGNENVEARSIRDKLSGECSLKNSKSCLRELFENGYYSVLKCGYVLDGEVEKSIEYMIMNGHYSFIYTNNISLIPDSLRCVLDSLSRYNKIEFVYDSQKS